MGCVLFIDASVREHSRTRLLADRVLERLSGTKESIKLCDRAFPVLDEAFLSMRDSACAAGDFSDPVFEPAKQFARADEIVIAAPYYDLSFPAALKQYFEQINVLGLTFGYGADGKAFSMCRAGRLFYVSTSGGPIVSDEYGFGYVRELGRYFYGIKEAVCFKAEGLDIYGADEKALLESAAAGIDRYFEADSDRDHKRENL